MDTATNDCIHDFDIVYTVEGKRIIGRFKFNKPKNEVLNAYTLASKLYGFDISNICDASRVRLDRDTKSYLLILEAGCLADLQSALQGRPVVQTMLTPNLDGDCIITDVDIVTLVVEFIGLLDPEIEWKLIGYEYQVSS